MPAAARQADLFGGDDLERVPRRPSPATVLFLENGGGKSVLLKLVFSVLLPGRRQVVGTTSTDVLPKFVLGEDVAHIACEWMHTTSGALLVTGKVSEWPGHVASADPQRLSDAWYSFRPGPGFGLDDLPFTLDGRRVTMASFKDRLHGVDPAAELVWETAHREWTRHLVDVGLDPELFRYQRAMNAEEGEAAEAFSFGSDEAFVDFLLRAVLDPEEPQALADLVAGYAQKIAQRVDLENERDFVEGTLERLEPLESAEKTAAAARAAGVSAQQAVADLAAAIVARRADEDERLEAAVALLEVARAEEAAAAQDERRLREITTELRRLVAELTLAETERADVAARDTYDAAQARVDAWQAVEPVLAHQLATSEAQRLRRVVDAEQERARPALRARQAAAAALAAGLLSTLAGAEAAAAAAAGSAAEAEERANAARARELEQAKEAAGHTAAADAAHLALAEVRERIAAAVAAGLVSDAEADVATAADQAESEAEDASRRAHGVRRRAQRAAQGPTGRRRAALRGASPRRCRARCGRSGRDRAPGGRRRPRRAGRRAALGRAARRRGDRSRDRRHCVGRAVDGRRGGRGAGAHRPARRAGAGSTGAAGARRGRPAARTRGSRGCAAGAGGRGHHRVLRLALPGHAARR